MDILSLIIGFALGAAACGAVLFSRLMRTQLRAAEMQAQIEAQQAAQESMTGHFKLTAQEAVQQAHESFLKLAEARLSEAHKDSAHDLDKRQRAIDDLIKPVHKNLEALNQVLEQTKGTDQALRADLQILQRETARLVGALRDPAAQGVWGEFVLEGLLDKSGLIKGVHYQTQVAMSNDQGRLRPDVVIHLQDGLHIVVDAKAPINEFVQQISSTLDESAQQNITTNLARQVREHVRKLGQKGYWENVDSADFTVLFIPSEPLFSMALRADPALIDYAAERNIIIASPTLLMSLLRVVLLSWRQVEIAKNAQEIAALGSELYKSLTVFADHVGKLGGALEGAVDAYNKSIGSLEGNVLIKARKFESLQPGNKNLDSPTAIDNNLRMIAPTQERKSA
ncbi:MAG: DNA recombination protein RmuC [Alphaproteobacteria bacterium]|nr:DNA recombination protein RmuC [Alphaproteobacteria bacterium]